MNKVDISITDGCGWKIIHHSLIILEHKRVSIYNESIQFIISKKIYPHSSTTIKIMPILE